MRNFTIKVPASSANIGPGFDVLGIALSLYLTVNVKIDRNSDSVGPLNCKITSSGLGSDTLPLDANENLVTRVALYVLRCNEVRVFPTGTHVHIDNQIPLGRGLGSSGAAVVAGVLLANYVGEFNLTKDRMLDYCLMIERHPDNISAALLGGFVGSFLRELSGSDLKRVEIPLAEVLPAPSGGYDTGLTPPEPPLNISHHIQFPFSSEIKAVCVIPDFEVSTATSRSVLPSAYPTSDAVYNLQRVSVLISALGATPVDAELVYLAMQDRLHQRYRGILVPGLAEILTSMNPRSHPGLVGICLSGAGPTVLALAKSNYDEIAADIVASFNCHGVSSTWKLLEVTDGASVEMLGDSRLRTNPDAYS